jgi:chromosome segregation ATPase
MELNNFKKEAADLESEIVHFEKKLNDKDLEMLSAVSKLETDNQAIQAHLNQEQKLVKALNEEIQKLNNVIDGFGTKVEELSGQLLNKETEFLSAMEKMGADKEELERRFSQEQQKVGVLNEDIAKLNAFATDHVDQGSEIEELKEQLLRKDSEILAAVTKMQADNHALQERIQKENQSSKNMIDTLNKKISQLIENLKCKEDELLALEKLRETQIKDNAETAIKDSAEKVNHDNLANDNEELKCQLRLNQKELDMLYLRITEQEIQIRSLNMLEPKIKDLEDQLESLDAKYKMLEKTAEQTNSLNDDLNAKYLEAIKKSKNLENVVKKLYKQIEAKRNGNDENDPEKQSIGDKGKSSSNSGHDHKTSIPLPNNGSTPMKPLILKRSSSDVEKNAESSSILKETRTANSKQKLGPAARVPAIESRKIRKIDTSRDGRQECNQQ